MRFNHRFSAKHVILLALLCMWVKTVAVSFVGFELPAHSLADALVMLINPIGSLLLLIGASVFLTKTVNMKWLLFSMLLLTGLIYGDLLYYRFYIDYVTVSILFQFKNVGGIGPSTFELMSSWDLLLFADILIIAWASRKTTMPRETVSRRTKGLYFSISATILIINAAIGLIHSPHLFTASYNREQMVKAIGPFNYHLYDIATGVRPSIDRAMATHLDTGKIVEYISEKDEKKTELFGIAKGKNIVMISMESTQNFVINQKVGGKEITPFLNGLIKESFYFDQVYDQTAQGKTSDSEFMIDTSLYPLSGGSVFVRRPDNVFNSLQQLLKEEGGYYSAAFHGNDASFWNREQMYESLGYNRFFSKKDYQVTDDNSINYGIKDIPFFEQTVTHMSDLPSPYFAKLITLTNHFPFLLDEDEQFISMANTGDGVVNRYVTTVRYQDEAIKQLFDQLKSDGMYENTIFILYGDHYGISEKYETALTDFLENEESPINHTLYKQVPVIIHIPGLAGETISTPGGEVDIRPTLLHLLGIESENLMSFGHNLLTRSNRHPVVFRDGSFVNDKYVMQNNICYKKATGEAIPESECEKSAEIVRDELRLSDEIIYGDLLRFMKIKQ
ncbi:LTA synthase family protein [Cytobacillus purgationiresistens]|uniref:Lipoteichoic acid synthase n=1 Tax=Cytobacillus purgationiresistens TaxID=863449 RepID=A0ABU0AME3_9BACI|nr:LTA synthase family protein [Cytobacillus purgationiresistens]MDQ0272220.1 lipoteichoic acid synthase [Cytobacillus purgationiresistens]